jgi:uncharacterized protein (TIGR03086 family)
MVAALGKGETPPEHGDDLVGADPKAAFASSVDTAREALSAPGVLEKIVATPFGDQPGTVLVAMAVAEAMVHGWDVASATGQSTDLDSELAEAVLAQWKSRLDGHQRPEGGPIGAEQPAPEGATGADRLAAYLGRKVA